MVHDVSFFNVEADSAVSGAMARIQQFQVEVSSNRNFLFGVEFYIVS